MLKWELFSAMYKRSRKQSQHGTSNMEHIQTKLSRKYIENVKEEKHCFEAHKMY
jgi:hypothetical protein